MDFNTVMCILGVLAYVVACGTSVSVLFQKEETACTVNTWDHISADALHENSHQGALSNVKAALVVIYLAGICFVSGLGAAIIGLVFADLPIFLLFGGGQIFRARERIFNGAQHSCKPICLLGNACLEEIRAHPSFPSRSCKIPKKTCFQHFSPSLRPLL